MRLLPTLAIALFFSPMAIALIKRVLNPQPNKKDLVDIPEDVLGPIEVIFCDRIEQVLANALM